MAGGRRRGVGSKFLQWWASAYSNPTEAEAALEPAIAALGLRYRVQHPVFALNYRVDFALPDLRVIIEVDDRSHREKAKQQSDAERTQKLNAHGWTVLRTTNEAALTDPRGTVARLMTDAGLTDRIRELRK